MMVGSALGHLSRKIYSIILVNKDLIAIKNRCQERGYASFMLRADVLGINQFNVGEWA